MSEVRKMLMVGPTAWFRLPGAQMPVKLEAHQTYYWDGNEDWEDDQQAALSSLAADTTDPLQTRYGATTLSAGPSIISDKPMAPASVKPPSSSTKSAPKPTAPSSGSSPSSFTNLNTTVQVGLDKVLVGDVSQYSLNSSLAKLMTPLCGAASRRCDTNATTILGIASFDGGGLGTGGLTFSIQNSNYTSTNQASAMIGLVANAIQNSATGSNCHLHTWRQDCRVGDSHDDPDDTCETKSMTTCMAADNIYVSANDPKVFPSQVTFMNVQFHFDYESEDIFACEEALAALLEIADFAVPEAAPAVPEDPEILVAIEALCMEITGDNPGGQ